MIRNVADLKKNLCLFKMYKIQKIIFLNNFSFGKKENFLQNFTAFFFFSSIKVNIL